MKLITFLNLTASMSGFLYFILSVWDHDINPFALATSLYALGSFLEELTEELTIKQ